MESTSKQVGDSILDTTDNYKYHQTLQGRIYVYPFNPFWPVRMKKTISNNNNSSAITTTDWMLIQKLIRDSYNTREMNADIFSVWKLSIFKNLIVFIIPIFVIYIIFGIFRDRDTDESVIVRDMEGIFIKMVLFILILVYMYHHYRHQTLMRTIQDSKYFWMRFISLSILICIFVNIKIMYMYWIVEGFKISIPYGIVFLVQWYNRLDKLLQQVHYAIEDALSEREDLYCRLKINYDYQGIAIDVFTINLSSSKMTISTLYENDPNIFSYDADHPLLMTVSDMEGV